MTTIKLTDPLNRHCHRCHKDWESKSLHPCYCPRCKSPYWDRMRLDGGTGGCRTCEREKKRRGIKKVTETEKGKNGI
jgi:hypothetical protein